MDTVGLNPFEEGDSDECLDSLPTLQINSEDLNETVINNSKSFKTTGNELSIDNIAARLINDRFILTALELHMELMESGHELPRFRDFFSNPANFERGRTIECNKLTRTSSIQTFDSLDFARYSDDGERHESDRIAVLEFELRKAHEKINSLRSSLTKTAETDLVVTSSESATFDNSSSDENLLPYEKRALNFLINEYLLKHGYKLTSVTFSEENDGQDFDDWDDVGINISKPHNLVKLLRDYGHHAAPLISKRDFECMALIESEECSESFVCNNSIDENEILTLQDKVKSIEQMLELKSKENLELKASIEDLISSKPFTEDTSNSSCDLKREEPSLVSDELQITPRSSGGSVESSQKNQSPEGFHRPTSNDQLVFNSFQKSLFDIIYKNNVTSVFKYMGDTLCLSSPIPKCLILIIETLADALPRIVPNILLAKRDELIPLLITAAALHPEESRRDELLSLIFNLIKRPRIDQRQAIINGCITFAQHVGPLKTECELLPQCWQQIFHKYPERRLLVAETCGSLSPYVSSITRHSLLFSMLEQMSADKEEDVRESVVKSLAYLVSFFEGDEKYNQTINLLSKFLVDPSEKVVATTKSLLLPSIARWSTELKCLQKFLNHVILDSIESSVYVASTTSTSSHYVVKDQRLFVSNMTNLQGLLPYIFSYIISSCYEHNNLSLESTENPTSSSEIKESLCLTPTNYSTGTESLNRISSILCNDKADILVRHFYATVSQEWFAMWDEYDWLSSGLVHRIVEMSGRLEISQPALHSLVLFCRELCRMFGENFTLTLLKSRFEKLLLIPCDENSLDRAIMNGQSILNRAIVPIFVAGIYPTILSNKNLLDKFSENYDTLLKFLCDLLGSLAIHQSTLISLQASFTELCSSDFHQLYSFRSHDLLLQVLWEFGIIHKCHLIRAATAHMFECLIMTCGLSETITSSKVVPALVTLASDPDECVRVSTISPFGAVLEYISTTFDANNTTVMAIIDKVQLQLQAFMEEPQTSNESKSKEKLHASTPSSSNGNSSILEIIKVLGRLGPKVDSKFRDEFVLPRLTALAVRNQLSLNGDPASKQEITLRLLDAFISISCCFLNQQVSQEVVLPGLRCLHHDIQMFAPDKANIVMSMMKEVEDKIEDANKLNQPPKMISTPTFTKNQDQPSSSIPLPSQIEMTRHNLLSRIRDVKDKASNAQFTKMFHISKK